jgi:hypothetical protein
MSALDAYKLYNALKLHFSTEDYDYFKYSGRTRSKFLPENQFHTFEKLYKKYNNDLETFYVSNFVENPKAYVFDLLSEESNERYIHFLKKNESLTYLFKQDTLSLIDGNEDFNSIFIPSKDHPILMKEVLKERVNLETLLILNSILRFFPNWNKSMKDDIIWKSFKLKCIKYFPFMKFDKDKMKTILKTEVKKLS